MRDSVLADPAPGTRTIRRGGWRFSRLVALVWAVGVVAIHAQKPSPVDVESVRGEWRSTEQFEGQSRAVLIVQEDGALLAGSLTLLGMTRGGDDRATMRTSFRDGQWKGTALTFDTILPDNEGKATWSLQVTAPGKATLQTVAENGKPDADGPSWEMRRQ